MLQSPNKKINESTGIQCHTWTPFLVKVPKVLGALVHNLDLGALVMVPQTQPGLVTKEKRTSSRELKKHDV